MVHQRRRNSGSVASAVDESVTLWRLFGVMMDVTATARREGDAWAFRIEQAGQLLEMRIYRERATLDARSREVYEQLIGQGWKPRM